MDWKIPIKNEINSLLIVAHPDDDTIFCGGTMLTYPDWYWTVVCMTEKKGSVRYDEFHKAMEAYRGYGVNINSCHILGQDDIEQGKRITEKDILPWRKVIQKQGFDPDIVFTHNRRGEYGHSAHKALSLAVNDLFPNIWEFIYPLQDQPYKTKINEVALSKEILEQKNEIFNSFYKSQARIWDVLVDLMPYAFKGGREIFTSD